MNEQPEMPEEQEPTLLGRSQKVGPYIRGQWLRIKPELIPHRGNRGIYATVVGLIALAAFSIVTVTQYFETQSDILPPIKQHSDVARQPLYTFNESLAQQFPADLAPTPASHCQTLKANWLQVENQNPGVSMTNVDWKALDLFNNGGSALWLNKESATCGDTIQIHASLTARYGSDVGPRKFSVMRVGYYGGAGAREIWNSGPIKLSYRVVPRVRTLTRTVETNWPTTTSFVIGNEWTPGLYLVAVYSPSGQLENWAPFILRSPQNSSKLVLVHSTLTWQSYNTFGGRSAYLAPVDSDQERSKVVSFDRPYAGSGIMHIDRDAVSLVQFLESENIATDQITDIDLATNPSLIKNYSGLILSGHPEYMTHNEFASILAARNQGTNLALLGANSAYWQVRLQSSPIGDNRRFAIYRDAKIDPITAPDKLTVEFGDSRINWQPSLITGEKTAGVHVYGNLNLVQKPAWLNIPSKLSINGWPSNSEIDSQAIGQASPPNEHLFLSGKFTLANPNSVGAAIKTRSLQAQSIWFTVPSGAAEFASGENYWPCELSGFCVESKMASGARANLRSITAQILQIWQHKAVGRLIDPTAYTNSKK